MNKDELKKAWAKFTEPNDFVLNPNEEHVNKIIDGVLDLEKKYGLKLCPCRLRNGSLERDLELICPCNFKIQANWKTKGECWCGLFTRR